MTSLFRGTCLLVGALFCFCSCAKDLKPATYAYKGFDSNHKLIIEGVMNFNIGPSNQVRGDWALQKAAGADTKNIGPQIGTGKLEGHLDDGTISLNLNPGWADNNVELHGQITKTNMSGDWGFYGFAGRMNGGNFEASAIDRRKPQTPRH